MLVPRINYTYSVPQTTGIVAASIYVWSARPVGLFGVSDVPMCGCVLVQAETAAA